MACACGGAVTCRPRRAGPSSCYRQTRLHPSPRTSSGMLAALTRPLSSLITVTTPPTPSASVFHRCLCPLMGAFILPRCRRLPCRMHCFWSVTFFCRPVCALLLNRRPHPTWGYSPLCPQCAPVFVTLPCAFCAVPLGVQGSGRHGAPAAKKRRHVFPGVSEEPSDGVEGTCPPLPFPLPLPCPFSCCFLLWAC